MRTKETIKSEWRRMDGADKIFVTIAMFMVIVLLSVTVIVTHGIILYVIFLGWAFIAFMNWFSREKPRE